MGDVWLPLGSDWGGVGWGVVLSGCRDVVCFCPVIVYVPFFVFENKKI